MEVPPKDRKAMKTSKKITLNTPQEPSRIRIWCQDWKKFDLVSFAKDIKLKNLLRFLLLVGVFIIFRDSVLRLWDDFIVHPILSRIKSEVICDLFFLALCIYSIANLIVRLRRHVVPSLYSLFAGVIVAVLFGLVIKGSGKYYWVSFSISYFNQLDYATTCVISLLIITLSYKSYLKPLFKKADRYTLLEDNPAPEKYSDAYSRQGYAKDVARHINSTATETSFSIGVIGEWGSGKSDFMKRLKGELNAKKQRENIVWEFNPWRVNKADAIIDEFFKTLAKELEPYSHSIGSTISDYSSRVLKSSKEMHYRFLDTLINNWISELDLQEKYDTINSAIKSTSKRMVVFIDDVDRLTGKEVMEVLRIVRNTANFSNTFFVIGIDQDYIINVLKNTKDFTNEEEYLKKVFQLTITLPAFRKNSFLQELKKYIITEDLPDSAKTAVLEGLSRIGIDSETHGTQWFSPEGDKVLLLEGLLDSMRDLKRFCNSFKIAFNILEGEVEVTDLLVLELIRNKNLVVYNAIRDRTILSVSGGLVSTFGKKRDTYEKLLNALNEKDRTIIETAVDFLLEDKKYKNHRKFVLTENFYVYFSYQLFDQISFKEFNGILNSDPLIMEQELRKMIKDGKGGELVKIFAFINEFLTAENYRKTVKVLARLSPENRHLFEHVKGMVLDWKTNQARFFNNDKNLQRDFFCELMNDTNIPSIYRASLAKLFWKSIDEGGVVEEDFYLKKKELRNIIYSLFDCFLKSNPNEISEIFEFYFVNSNTIKDERFIIFPPASKILRKYLRSNENAFKDYIKHFIRPYTNPYIGTFVMDPFMEQIFGSLADFKEELMRYEFEESDLDEIQAIIMKRIDDQYNQGNKSFRFDNEQDKILIERVLGLKSR